VAKSPTPGIPATRAEYAAFIDTDPRALPLVRRVRALVRAPAHRPPDLYEAGRLLREALRPVSRYRLKWAEAVADRLGVDPSVVHKLVKFATRFTAEQAAEFGGCGVTWSHIDQALKIRKSDDAYDLLVDAADREWGVRKLQLHLKSRSPNARSRNRKPPPPPASHGLEVDLGQLARRRTELRRLLEHHWDRAPAELAARSATHLDAESRERAAYEAGQLRALAADCQRLADRLQAVAEIGR